MTIIAWIILGLIVGAIGKAIMPGRIATGWLGTILLGIVGALVGGWLGSILFDVELEGFFSIETWLVAIAGTVLVLFIAGLFGVDRRRA